MSLFNVPATAEITDCKYRLPTMTDGAMFRNQNRIMDIAPGEWVLAREGSVNWDSYGEPGAQYFTLDTWNDYQTDGITPLYMSYMPFVMKACVTTESGELLTDYIVDLRYVDDITRINRPMEIDPANPSASHMFRHYQRTKGATILRTLLLPQMDGSTLWCPDPNFEGPALDFADKVDALFGRYYGQAHKPQAVNYMGNHAPILPGFSR